MWCAMAFGLAGAVSAPWVIVKSWAALTRKGPANDTGACLGPAVPKDIYDGRITKALEERFKPAPGDPECVPPDGEREYNCLS